MFETHHYTHVVVVTIGSLLRVRGWEFFSSDNFESQSNIQNYLLRNRALSLNPSARKFRAIPRRNYSKEKTLKKGAFSSLVAGLGIAPRPGGYEPPEILLLHPAIYALCIYTKPINCHNLQEIMRL